MPEPTIRELERALSTLTVGYPPTPDLVSAVTSRLSAQRRQGVRPPLPGLALWSRRRVLVAVAIGLLAALAVAAAARLAIGALEIRVQPGVTAAPSATTVDPGDLGRPTSVAEAEAEVGFRVSLPPGPAPDEVYVAEGLVGRSGLVLAWGPAPGAPAIAGTDWHLVLMAFPSDIDVALKTVGGVEQVHETTVGGRTGFWLDAPHLIWFETDDGPKGPYRVPGNVLIWDTAEGLTYRMETPLRRDEAIALAERFT